MNRLWCGIALTVVGCSHDIGSLYRQPGHSQGPVSEPIPSLPALPDSKWIDGCAACAETTCPTERSNCLEDDACTAELRCKGECNDPACLQTCSALHGWSPWYADYTVCVFGQCPSDCNTGANWECVRGYDWPAAKQDTFVVLFRFGTPPAFLLGGQSWALAAGTVRACLDEPECNLVDSAPASLDNTVSLKILPNTVRPLDFRGYLEFETQRARTYTTPLSQAQEYFASFAAPFPGYQPTQVTVAVVDCLATPVSGARVYLPDVPGASTLAWASAFGFQAAEQTTSSGVVLLVNLPDTIASARLRVRAEHMDTHEGINERSIWARVGFNTQVILGPATRSD